jgi:hypothetical protein
MESLLNAFILTANNFSGDFQTLEAYWDSATQTGQFSAATIGDYIQGMKKRGYPAAHHSEEYKRKYRPAYRVISRKILIHPEIKS